MTQLQKKYDIFDMFDAFDAFDIFNTYFSAKKLNEKPKEEYEFKVPGFGKDDLNAKITSDGYLKITGDNGVDTFKKILQIPGLNTQSKITLKCDKGILKIKIPKNEDKEITIN